MLESREYFYIKAMNNNSTLPLGHAGSLGPNQCYHSRLGKVTALEWQQIMMSIQRGQLLSIFRGAKAVWGEQGRVARGLRQGGWVQWGRVEGVVYRGGGGQGSSGEGQGGVP